MPVIHLSGQSGQSGRSASVTVTKELEIELVSLKGSAPRSLKVRVSRIEAQRIAETLRAFAMGSTTKAVGARQCDVFIAQDRSEDPYLAPPFNSEGYRRSMGYY